MLRLSVMCSLVALLAGILGFGLLTGPAAYIAKVFFIFSLVLLLFSTIVAPAKNPADV